VIGLLLGTNTSILCPIPLVPATSSPLGVWYIYLLGLNVFYNYWVEDVSSGSGCCIGEVLLRLMLLRKWRLKALVIPSPRFWMVCIWGVGAVWEWPKKRRVLFIIELFKVFTFHSIHRHIHHQQLCELMIYQRMVLGR
jgi:hypothetical protein